MSVTYDKFLPEVLPYVHDCPEIAALNAIRNAVIEFCKESLYLLYTSDPFSALPNVSEYELDVPDGYVCARILDGWCDNMQLRPKSEEDLRGIYQLDWRTMVGRPQYITQIEPSTVWLVPQPQVRSPNAVKVILAIQPSRDSTSVASVIWERWAEVIGFGARARLLATPGQPYYDPSSAMQLRAFFEEGINKAEFERNRGLGRTTTRVRPPRLV